MQQIYVFLLVHVTVGTRFCEGYFQNSFDLFPELPLGVPSSDNPVCREQSELFVDNLKNLTLWAHESKYMDFVNM